MTFQGRKLVLGKMGLDGHDNGIRIVSKWLLDAGYEVVYAGLYNNPQSMVQIAMQEDADAIGISSLEGEHLDLAARLQHELAEKGVEQTKIIMGGVISPEDVSRLEKRGIDLVFTPGTPRQDILDRIAGLWAGADPACTSESGGGQEVSTPGCNTVQG